MGGHASERRDDQSGDDLLAVFAHSLLGPAMAAGAIAKILQDRPSLPPAKRRELLHVLIERSRFVSGLLEDVVRIGSPALLDALAELGHLDRVGPRH